MAIVDLLQLQKHASQNDYNLGFVLVPTTAIAKGVLNKVEELDAPVVLSVNASRQLDELMPTLELLARRAKVAVAIVASNIKSVDQAVLAIRYGCNGLLLKNNLASSIAKDINEIADSCGIPVVNSDNFSDIYVNIDTELETVSLETLKQAPTSWQQLDELVEQRSSQYIHNLLNSTRAIGQGKTALEACDICQPVEHLIIYNFNADDSKTAELAAKGREVLDKIPGVRQTWSGYSVKNDASYRWCWLFRFANSKVIDSYREHPDHVAYADNLFRPYAADRISIDYELIGTEEEK